nr:hypothetical protein [uncultured Acetobacter sp.]
MTGPVSSRDLAPVPESACKQYTLVFSAAKQRHATPESLRSGRLTSSAPLFAASSFV